MLRRIHSVFEPFILTLVATVTLASFLPPVGAAVPLFGGMADAGIVLLFFLHGAKLSREAILAGARNWRLHLAVFCQRRSKSRPLGGAKPGQLIRVLASTGRA